MNRKDSFAIMDLETTQPSVASGGRIIQIGITFVKQGRIVEHFDSFVNPGCDIDRHIQQLTHITPKDVQDAPYFEEIAPVLRNLLSDQVIVAHNVNFDYPYLNDEFERVGFPRLDLAAVDTVQLSQILLPLAPGYRLIDVTRYLNLPLQDAHRANADAQATAQLLLALWQRAANLPNHVKKELANTDWGLLRQTQDFLKLALAGKGQPSAPGKNVIKSQVPNQPLPTFLTQQAQKEQYLGNDFRLQDGQNQLMNRIHKFIGSHQPAILNLQTRPKMGKTLGYLLPLYFENNPRPALLLSQDISLLNQQAGILQCLNQRGDLPVRTTATLYQPQQYLDQTRFEVSLKKAAQEGGHIWQARLLVWLSQTETGLLLEMPVGLHVRELLPVVAGDGQSNFYQRAWQAAQIADIVMMDYDTYWTLGDQLRVARQLKAWPLVILEKPLNFVQYIQKTFATTLPLTAYQEQMGNLQSVLDEMSNTTDRSLLKSELATCQNMLQQLLNAPNSRNLFKNARHFLAHLMALDDRLVTSGLRPFFGHFHLEKASQQLAYLAANRLLVEGIALQVGADHHHVNLVVKVASGLIYQHLFIKHITRTLIVSDFLPADLIQFFAKNRSKSTQWQTETVGLADMQVELIAPTANQFNDHLAAVTAAGASQLLVLVPNSAAISDWYQRLRSLYGDRYQVVAENITAPLIKLNRQYRQSQAIIIVGPDYLTHLWQQKMMLPKVVLVPDLLLWQRQDDWRSLLVALQGVDHGVLISPLSRQIIRRMPDYVRIHRHFKGDLVAFYQQHLGFN